MYWFEQIGVIILMALLGNWVLYKLRFPAPAIIGPVVFIGSFQVLGGMLSPLPINIVDIFQIIIGLSIGATINAKKLTVIRQIWIPVLLVFFWTIFFTLLMTLLINYFYADLLTAFFSAAPGGINVMATLALSYHSEVAIVSTYQFVRLLVILSVVPLIAKTLKKRPSQPEMEAISDTTDLSHQSPNTTYSSGLIWRYGAGILAGLLLTMIHFPSGGIIGSLVGLAAMNVWLRKETSFPPLVMKVALLGIGASIGLEFSPLMVSKLHEMFLQIIIFSIIIVLSNFILAYVLHRITQWDIITCLLSAASGGLSQMLVVGEEMQANTLVISVLQLVRMLTIVTCIPLTTALISI